MSDAAIASAFYKSAGFFYIGKETNQALIGHDHSNPATSRNEGVLVRCRALSEVIPDRQHSLCVSLVDPENPGWYLTHRGGYLYFEPEYNPPNRDTFDNDTSFYITRNHFFTGFSTWESFNRQNHFVHSTTDGKLALSVFEDTPQFHSAASYYPTRYSSSLSGQNLVTSINQILQEKQKTI